MKTLFQIFQSFKLKFVTLSGLLLFVFTNCDDNFQKPEEKTIETIAISEGLKAFIGDGNASMKNVSTFFAEKYNFDFDAEYKKLKPKFISKKYKDSAMRSQTIDINLYNFQTILDSNGITYGSYSYNYLSQLSNIFENGNYEEFEIKNMISQMRSEIENNYLMSDYEKSNLLLTWDAIIVNYDGLVQVSNSIYNGEIYAMARTQGWFRSAWRVVRSVILTAGVGFVVGIIASGGNPIAGIVGAIITGVAAILDAVLNDYCHFAMQCDGGWRQDCSTGICVI